MVLDFMVKDIIHKITVKFVHAFQNVLHLNKNAVRIWGILLGLALSAASCALGDSTGSSGWYWYSVYYDANGGKGTMENSKFTTNIPGQLRKNAFTLADHTFMGWLNTASSPFAAHKDEDTVTYHPDGTGIRLYPVWARYPGFVWVDPGTFTIGSPFEEYWPATFFQFQYEVTLANGFYMAQYPVTQKEWKDVMGTEPRGGYTGDTLPLERASWYDAVEYCNALSAKEGLTKAYTITTIKDSQNKNGNDQLKWTVTLNINANGYRLPTSAEWEYAARGGPVGSKTYYTYAGSNNVDEVAWYDGNSGGIVHPVGTKSPNYLALYDMSGNVWEWCWDWHEEPKEPNGVVVKDPEGPPTGEHRVQRGGSAGRPDKEVRSGNWGYSGPDSQMAGFRLVKSW